MNKTNKMNELPLLERPYERCINYGPSSLSDAQLLAAIIKTGSKNKSCLDIANDILNLHPVHKGLIGIYYLTIDDLKGIDGVGYVKAINILCIAELSKRLSKTNRYRGIAMNSPESIANYFMEELRNCNHEEIHAMFFDTKHHMISSKCFSKGTVNASIITPREVFIDALKYGAVFMILIHNHPSGDSTPSLEDIKLTKRFKAAGDLIGIELSDHIIIGDLEYTSLCEKGYV